MAGGARATSGGDPCGGRGGGGCDGVEGAGEGGGRVSGAAEDRGEQGDCAVAGGERERVVHTEQRGECAAECAEQVVAANGRVVGSGDDRGSGSCSHGV